MRFVIVVLFSALVLAGCDDTRLYETNHDFANQYWTVQDTPAFQFTVKDTVQSYNLYCNLRNSVSYPYARIFISYALLDSSGTEVKRELINGYLFDKKTGEPLGTSGLGDIYDQQLPLLMNYSFTHPGNYSIRFEQFMRTDTLQGVLAVGLRVERTVAEK